MKPLYIKTLTLYSELHDSHHGTDARINPKRS